jgi:uncharacterized protein (TIGR02284 family)
MKTTSNSSSITNRACIDVCNRLLRGELSAIETYRQTIEKFAGDPAATTLRQIQTDHEYAAELLRNNVLEMGGSPSIDSGAWGSLTSAVQGVAKTFGESAALKGLQRGEEHGLDDYEDALEDDDVMSGCKDMIRAELLSRTRQHIASLEELSRRL